MRDSALDSSHPCMVGVAQLVELRIVVPVVVGSIPIAHPNLPSSAIPGTHGSRDGEAGVKWGTTRRQGWLV